MQKVQIQNCGSSCVSGQTSTGRFCNAIHDLKNSRGRFMRLHYAYPKSQNNIVAKYVSHTERSVTLFNTKTRSNVVLPLSRLVDLRVG